MYVLALDTALAACSAAVLDTRHGILASVSVAMRRGHAEALLPAVHQVMDDAGVTFSDLDRIAVTVDRRHGRAWKLYGPARWRVGCPGNRACST